MKTKKEMENKEKYIANRVKALKVAFDGDADCASTVNRKNKDELYKEGYPKPWTWKLLDEAEYCANMTFEEFLEYAEKVTV